MSDLHELRKLFEAEVLTPMFARWRKEAVALGLIPQDAEPSILSVPSWAWPQDCLEPSECFARIVAELDTMIDPEFAEPLPGQLAEDVSLLRDLMVKPWQAMTKAERDAWRSGQVPSTENRRHCPMCAGYGRHSDTLTDGCPGCPFCGDSPLVVQAPHISSLAIFTFSAQDVVVGPRGQVYGAPAVGSLAMGIFSAQQAAGMTDDDARHRASMCPAQIDARTADTLPCR